MRKKNLPTPVILLAAGSLCFILYRFPPEQCRIWPPCLFHRLTGVYCPGCGNTRALSSLLHGDIVGSLSKNILLIPMIGCLLALKLRPSLASNRIFSWSVAVVVIIFFVARNLPWHPFSLLAPH